MEENEFVSESGFWFSSRNAETAAYAFLCFIVPFAFGHAQLFTGTAVNAILIFSSLRLGFSRTLPAVIMPSLGVLAAGALFGPMTPVLLYMIPSIWLGNAVIAAAFTHLRPALKMRYPTALIAGGILKSGLLFASAFALFSIGLAPSALLIAFGPFQLLTALLGGAAAYAGIRAAGIKSSFKSSF